MANPRFLVGTIPVPILNPVPQPSANAPLCFGAPRKRGRSAASPNRSQQPPQQRRRLSPPMRRDSHDSRGSDQAVLGLCPDMCPDSERGERKRKGDLDRYERLDGDRNQTSKHLAVKKYNRTAKREAELIRPMPVLQKTVDHLLGLLDRPYKDFLSIYNCLWDSMRAVRMDLRVQHISNHQAIVMLEQMIRLHIVAMHELCEHNKGEGFVEGFDAYLNIEQINKASAELFQMYDDHRKKGISVATEMEFRGYYALLKLDKHLGHKVTPAELSLDLAKMAPEIKRSPEILFAREVAGAYRAGNYVAFFRLARKATYLQACLMHAHFAKIRTQALASLHSSLQNNRGIPLSDVMRWLGLEEGDAENLVENHGFRLKKFEETYMIKEGPFLNGDTDFPTRLSRLVQLKKSQRIISDICPARSISDVSEKKETVCDGGTEKKKETVSNGGIEKKKEIVSDGGTEKKKEIVSDGSMEKKKETVSDSGTEKKNETVSDGGTEKKKEIVSDGGTEKKKEIVSDGSTEKKKETVSDSGTEKKKEIVSDGSTEKKKETVSDRGTEKKNETVSDGGTEKKKEIVSDGGTEKKKEIVSDGSTEKKKETVSDSGTEKKKETVSDGSTEKKKETVSDSGTEKKNETVSDGGTEKKKEIVSDGGTEKKKEIVSDGSTEKKKETVSDSGTEKKKEIVSDGSTEKKKETVSDRGTEKKNETVSDGGTEKKKEIVSDGGTEKKKEIVSDGSTEKKKETVSDSGTEKKKETVSDGGTEIQTKASHPLQRNKSQRSIYEMFADLTISDAKETRETVDQIALVSHEILAHPDVNIIGDTSPVSSVLHNAVTGSMLQMRASIELDKKEQLLVIQKRKQGTDARLRRILRKWRQRPEKRETRERRIKLANAVLNSLIVGPPVRPYISSPRPAHSEISINYAVRKMGWKQFGYMAARYHSKSAVLAHR